MNWNEEGRRWDKVLHCRNQPEFVHGRDKLFQELSRSHSSSN